MHGAGERVQLLLGASDGENSLAGGVSYVVGGISRAELGHRHLFPATDPLETLSFPPVSAVSLYSAYRIGGGGGESLMWGGRSWLGAARTVVLGGFVEPVLGRKSTEPVGRSLGLTQAAGSGLRALSCASWLGKAGCLGTGHGCKGIWGSGTEQLAGKPCPPAGKQQDQDLG